MTPLRAGLFALATSAWGCFGPAPVSAPLETPEGVFIQTFAKSACSSVGKCCVAKGLGALDTEGCELLVRASMKTLLETKSGSIDAAGVSACLKKAERYGKQCVDPELPLGLLDGSVCDGVFQGGRAPGEPCSTHRECARSGTATRALCDGERHRCELYRSAREGEPCVGNCDAEQCDKPKGDVRGAVTSTCDLERGLFCDGATKRCKARGSAGAACGDKAPCASGAACVEGRCEQAGAGASCAASVEVCGREASCDSGSKTCVGKKKRGEGCSDNGDCASGNCAGRVCRELREATMLYVGNELSVFCPPKE